MEQKIKFIIIGLIAVLVISLLFNVQFFSAKQQIARERDSLKEENASLEKKAEEALTSNKRLQDKINSLNQSLDALTKEKENLQKKYDLLDKTREGLLEQLKSLKAQTMPSISQEPGLPKTEDAYWARVLSQKKELELQLESLRNELKTVQINNEQLQKEKNTLEFEVSNLSREKQDLGRQLQFVQKQVDYNKRMVDTISLELVGEKNDKIQIQDILKSIKSENTTLRRQLKTLYGRKINLERKLAEAQKKDTELENRFTEMNILLKDKTLQIEKLNKQVTEGLSAQGAPQKTPPVELPPIVVRPQAETETSVSKELTPSIGRILAVNKDNNFVVIDVGEADGIKIGDVFRVYNKESNKEIGAIEVIEARRSISACDIHRETAPIKVGDTVR